MSDQSGPGEGDERKRIDVNAEDEVLLWSEMFEVTPEQLKAAVQEAGDQADAVWHFLQRSRDAPR
jgi:hypothetical protein